MSNFHTLNFKALLFAAIATIPTLLVLQGLDRATTQATAEALARNHQAPAAVERLALNAASRTVLVD